MTNNIILIWTTDPKTIIRIREEDVEMENINDPEIIIVNNYKKLIYCIDNIVEFYTEDNGFKIKED